MGSALSKQDTGRRHSAEGLEVLCYSTDPEQGKSRPYEPELDKQ